MKKAVFVAVLFFVGAVWANSVELELAQGKSFRSQTVSGSGDFTKDTDKSRAKQRSENSYNWNLSYAHTGTEVTSSSGESVKDNTHDFSFGLGLETEQKMTGGVSFAYSNSPEENLTSSGPQVYFGMSFEYGRATRPPEKSNGGSELQLEEEKSEAPPFVPRFGFELSFAQNNYKQSYASTAPGRLPGRTRPVTGDAKIAQKSVSLGLKWKPQQWLTVKVTGTGYSYDKDVAQFSQYLDANPVLSSSSLGGLLSGFPASSGKVSLNFYMGDDWDLALSASRSIAAIGQTVSSTSKAILGYQLAESWQVSLGAAVSKTEATSSAAESSDTQGLVALSKDF